MKILVISQYYSPDITAAAFRIAETVDHLKNLGNELEVITTYPHKIKRNEDIVSTEGVHRVTLPDTENKGFYGYIYLYVSFLIKSLLLGLKVGIKQKPDIIWASSPPIFVGLSGWLIAKILRAKFVLDIRDIWPDSAVEAGQISNSGQAYKFGRWLEKFLYRNATLVTCVATPMKKYIEEFTDKNVEVIYNGAEVFKGNGEKESSDLFFSKDDGKELILLYAGNFGHVQKLEILLDTFNDLNNLNLNFKWKVYLLGDGVKKEMLINKTSSLQLTNVIHFLKPVNKNEVFGYLKNADILFIHLMKSKVLSLTIPSKVFDYLIVNKPILAGIEGEGKNIIESLDGNFTFEPGNKEDLKNTIILMDEKFSKMNSILFNEEVVMTEYSRKLQSVKLNSLFKNIYY